MGLNIRAVYAWYSPDAGTYGSNVDAAPDGAGMLELDHTVGSVMAVDVLIGAPGVAKVIKGALVKDFSQTVKNNEAQSTTRLVYKNQVRSTAPYPFVRIYLQLLTVVDTVNSTFKFRLNDDDTNAENDSASSFSYGHGNKYDWLITTDSKHWILYVDGVEEIRIAQGREMGVLGGSALVSLLAQGSDDSGNTSTRFGGYAYIEFDGSPDRPDIASTVFAEGTLNGQSATHTDYDQGTGSGSYPNYLDVDDWEYGSQDDDATENHFQAAVGVTKLQAYTMPTYTVVNDHVSVVVQFRQKASVGGKVAESNIFIWAGTDIAHASGNILLNSWVSFRRMFEFAPGTSVTGATIAFVDGGVGRDSITDSNNGLAVFSADDIITVSGSASNDGDYLVNSVSAGTLTLSTGVLTDEAAGRTVSLVLQGTTDTWKDFSSWADLEFGQRTVTDPAEDAEHCEVTAIQGEILDLAVVAIAPPSAAEFEIMGIF